MEEKKKKKKLIHRLNNKYRLIIYNDKTFEELFWVRLSRLNLFTIIGISAIALIIIVIIVIAYTPIREFIPGYPNGEMTSKIKLNSIKVDSLESEIQKRDKYFDNLKMIIEGKDIDDKIHSYTKDTNFKSKNISFKKSKVDSVFRNQVEASEKFNLLLFDGKRNNDDFNSLHFFTPLKGLVTNHFNLSENHYGVDVVSKPDEVISATLDGTITLSSWTLETGYIIEIQHSANLISVYKHLSQRLKEVGSKVKAGEAIAIIGNSGELSSGPHLHFELWRNGIPLNPENYIMF
jgi:murein DD-endopeptidase MepM/ murein hydrolase activator NlpD